MRPGSHRDAASLVSGVGDARARFDHGFTPPRLAARVSISCNSAVLGARLIALPLARAPCRRERWLLGGSSSFARRHVAAKRGSPPRQPAQPKRARPGPGPRQAAMAIPVAPPRAGIA